MMITGKIHEKKEERFEIYIGYFCIVICTKDKNSTNEGDTVESPTSGPEPPCRGTQVYLRVKKYICTQGEMIKIKI